MDDEIPMDSTPVLEPICDPSPAMTSQIPPIVPKPIKHLTHDVTIETQPAHVRCINERVGLTPSIAVQISGTQRFAVIDTAAQISMLSSTMVSELGLLTASNRCPSITIKNAENDSFMDCIILALFPFNIAGTRYHHTFAVGPITDDVILGLDFLMEHQGVVHLPKLVLKLGAYDIPLKIVKTSSPKTLNVSQVFAAATCTLPPFTRRVVKVYTATNTCDFVTTPFQDRYLSVQSCVLSSDAGNTMEVSNSSSHPLMIHKDSVLTSAVQCDKLAPSVCDTSERTPPSVNGTDSGLVSSDLPESKDATSSFCGWPTPPPDDVAPLWPDGPPDIVYGGDLLHRSPSLQEPVMALESLSPDTSPFCGWPTTPPDIVPPIWPDGPPDIHSAIQELRVKSDPNITATTTTTLDPRSDGPQSSTILPTHLCALFESCNSLQPDQRNVVRDLLIDFADVFAKNDEDLGNFTQLAHHIRTVDDIPVRERLRRTPRRFMGEEEGALQKMLDGGIIEPSNSEWAAAPVLLRKRDGTVRYATDFRPLNAKTIRDSYPLPLIADCMDCLQGSTIFHVLDLAAGYWQVPVATEDAHKTAFITKYGLFQYRKMAFGLCNAPATFQRVMNLVLQGLLWTKVLVYLDDVIILGKNFDEAVENLRETLARFRKYNLKLKPRKCELFREEVKFLGRLVSKEGIRISDEHMSCLRDWPTPDSKNSLLKFLGFINYHREFVPSLSTTAEPLYAMTRKAAVFRWTGECQEAFDVLRNELLQRITLILPNDDDPFILDTDASDFALGACLYQVQGGQEVPVAFASQVLTPVQRRYCTTRKELLAIVVFTRQFRYHLLGRHFMLRTDHGSLAWLCRFKEPTGQLGRWLEELSQFDMAICHRPGVKHTNADSVSRIGSATATCNCYEAGRHLSDLPCGGCTYCSRLHNQWNRFENEVDYVVPLAVRQVSNTASTGENQATTDDDTLVSLEGYSREELLALQSADPHLAPITRWLTQDENPSASELCLQSQETKTLWRKKNLLLIRNGLLHYQWFHTLNDMTPLLVPPNPLRHEILRLAHDGAIGGHWGRDKTMSVVRKRFFWPALNRDVALHVSTCATCNTQKHRPKNRSPLEHFQAGIPNERVHLDFLGPFTESNRGNKYILSIIDQFTKWVELYPLPEQTALITAKTFFEGWICRFGVPLQVHTDQGRNFISSLFTNLCDVLQLSKTRTTPYRPSANGQVERYNRMVLSYIRCQLGQNDQEWDEHLPTLGLSLRATVNRSTGFTANQLQLGREINVPLDILFDLPTLAPTRTTPADYVQQLDRRMRRIFAETRRHLESAHLSQKRDYDTRAPLRVAKYDRGDLVYLINNAPRVGACAKLQPILIGPFLVDGIQGGQIYRIRGRTRSKVVHQDQLKLCSDRCIPLWVQRMRHRILEGLPPDFEDPAEDLGLQRLFDPPTDSFDPYRPPKPPDTNDVAAEDPRATPAAMDDYAVSRYGRQIRRPHHLDEYMS